MDSEFPTTLDSLIRGVAALPHALVAPGDVLGGSYELLERIGGGGMGIVFRARDRLLSRDVAIKVLRPRREGPGDLASLLQREARATAQLLHPNVVTLHHVGVHAGSPFLVFELLVGETLATRLARRVQLSPTESLAIADGVLAALVFAHERGVLHRDLKPGNVFLTHDERVKVLDFGLALTLDAGDDVGRGTPAAGTPGYMAPEQRSGAPLDERTDVWAAALLMAECLLGRRAHDLDPSAVGSQPSLPVPLRKILATALSPDPAQRPSSAKALRAELARAGDLLAQRVEPRGRWQARDVAIAALFAGGLGIAVGARLRHGRGDAVAASSVASAAVASPAVPSAAALGGLWETNFGQLALVVDRDGVAYGVYEHDGGVVTGLYRDGLLTGQWCEQPTRMWPSDGGMLELRFAEAARSVRLAGTWTYGRWSERPSGGKLEFSGTRVGDAIPDQLAKRLAAHERCP